jgi:SPP1 family predicted phage head-tail adaptor
MPANNYDNPWLGLNPGQLRHRLDVESFTETRDSFGQPITTWAVLHDGVKAFVEPLAGRELFQARQLHADVTHRITMRYVAGITPKHRISCGEREFDILSILNLAERNLILEILVKERV